MSSSIDQVAPFVAVGHNDGALSFRQIQMIRPGVSQRISREGQVGVGDDNREGPRRFSRGLRQKTALAVAFIRPFDLLLVDEPFVGLDAAGKDAVLQLFADAADDGAAVVVSTHELSFVERADGVLALRDGEVVHRGKLGADAVRDLVLP